MRYFERIPQRDLSGLAYGIAAGALLLLILAKLAETRLSEHAARPLLLLVLLPAVLALAPWPAPAAGPDAGPDLTRRDLTGLDLSGVDFRAADLFAANLSGSMLQGANFARANLNRVIANEADFSDANFAEASMFAVVMNGARLSGADLSKTRIIGELKNAFLDKVKMTDADLGADPANQGMVPVRVDMSGAILDGADLSQSNLNSVVLTFAKLRDATLVKTRFNWAKMAGADLSGADVTEADFTDADLDGALLNGLKGADSAKGLPLGQ
jgi:uncharacterized protein YjbI with pentapeptide repeats